MEPKDFYFELCRQVSGYFFLVTPKSYYDIEGCLSDKPGVAKEILPEGFYELKESTYQYEGTSETGRKILLDLGLKEISFGLQSGEPSRQSDEDYDDDFQEEEDELDMLLKDNEEPHPFDYKNISTDKLIRHRKIMIETEAFEEAAKIRDELISRGITE
jgi:hypothetical protein